MVLTTQVGNNSYFQAATYTHLDATKLDNFTLKADWTAGNLPLTVPSTTATHCQRTDI